MILKGEHRSTRRNNLSQCLFFSVTNPTYTGLASNRRLCGVKTYYSRCLTRFIILQKFQCCRGINGRSVIVITHLSLASTLEISGFVPVFILPPSYRWLYFEYVYMYVASSFEVTLFPSLGSKLLVITWPHLGWKQRFSPDSFYSPVSHLRTPRYNLANLDLPFFGLEG